MLEKKDLLERNSKLQSEVNKLKLKQNEKVCIKILYVVCKLYGFIFLLTKNMLYLAAVRKCN